MARSFNGTTDKITIGTGFTIPADNLTVFAWIYPTTLQQAGILGAAANNGLSFDATTSGQLQIVKTGVQGNWISTAGSPFSTGAWVAAGIDVNTGGSLAHFYTNGTLLTASPQNAWSSSTAHGLIGNTNTSDPFAGRLAHVAIWNVVLTAAEHKSLSAGALPFYIRTASLIGYWPLDGLSSPEPDLSGFANNGTLTGTSLAAGPPAMMFTPRWPQVTPAAAAASTVNFRRSLSALGTRAGTRQRQGLDA